MFKLPDIDNKSKQNKCFHFIVLSPVLRLLLTCLFVSPAWPDENKADTLLSKPVNWDAFIKIVYYHRTAPLVYRNLNRRE